MYLPIDRGHAPRHQNSASPLLGSWILNDDGGSV
jgi:hypothetical protein